MVLMAQALKEHVGRPAWHGTVQQAFDGTYKGRLPYQCQCCLQCWGQSQERVQQGNCIHNIKLQSLCSGRTWICCYNLLLVGLDLAQEDTVDCCCRVLGRVQQDFEGSGSVKAILDVAHEGSWSGSNCKFSLS